MPGYQIKASNKKNMGKSVTVEEIDFDEENTKKQVTLNTRLADANPFMYRLEAM